MIFRIFLALLFCSCSELPCLESQEVLTKVVVENGGWKWNCGLTKWQATEEELSDICQLLHTSAKINWASVRVSHWRLDIYLNDEEEKVYVRSLALFSSTTDGLILRQGDSYYKNDELATYLIQKLQITNFDSSLCE